MSDKIVEKQARKKQETTVNCQLVSVDKIIKFRNQHLLPNHQLAECQFPADILESSFHVATFNKAELVGIASFIQESKAGLSEDSQQYRLRQMAVDPKMRREGIGKLIVDHGVGILRSRGCELVWCHAREVAFDFYSILGFEFHGDFFNVERVGAHKIMYLKIT